ncbi:MAG: response regulator transcription factor [Eubacteriales bacterium]|nr:response regulator transcription factor [Eubacteriales bacterium]
MEGRDTILIVEDDASISGLLKTALDKAGYETLQAFSGTEAQMLLNMKKEEISLVLLDLMLPGVSGEAVLEEIRKQGSLPVMVLTAKDGLDDKLGLLNGGADDYITKPFEIKEVLARIGVQLRHARRDQEGAKTLLTHKSMELDRDGFEVRIGGMPLPKLTKQEFAILELLLRHPRQVFGKDEIFEYAWEEHYMGETKTLDVHISNIRKKIKAVTSEEYIETVWGIGYRLHS